MSRLLVVLFALAPLGCSRPPLVSQVTKDKTNPSLLRRYECHFTDSPISIDGIPNEAAWHEAQRSEFFVDIESKLKPRPRFETNFQMLWNAEYLYITALLLEPHVWATLQHHDEIVFRDNDFEVFIDPDGDARNYYEIEINALATVFDLLLERAYRDGGPARHDWNLRGLQKAVRVLGSINDPSDVDAGWYVEMAMPWKSLAEHALCASPPNAGDTWRLNFSRVEWQHELKGGHYRKIDGKREDNWVWSPQGVIDMHRPETWGYVTFVK